jgi:hypothetical protein
VIEYKKFITRQDLRNNPDKIFLFGDNLEQKGMGGQAAEMRGEPNAIGIPTKKKGDMDPSSFFYNEDNADAEDAIDAAFAKIPNNKVVVIPADGLGTGRARLAQTCPALLVYITLKIRELKDKAHKQA